MMFKSSSHSYKLYSQAIHSLLLEHPNGLNLTQILQYLGLDKVKCQEILKQEQIQGEIHGDPLSGEIIYTSLKNSSPKQLPYQKVLQKIKLTNLKTTLEFLSLFTCTIVSASLISLNVDFSIKTTDLYSSQKTTKNQKLMHNATDVDSHPMVKAKMAHQRKQELIQEIDDLNLRINHISLELKSNQRCISKWSQKTKCYLAGRMVTREELEIEVLEMKLQVAKNTEILDAY